LFLACYSQNASFITNFKLIASVAAEINRGKTWLCQMWKNPTFIGAVVKIFL